MPNFLFVPPPQLLTEVPIGMFQDGTLPWAILGLRVYLSVGINTLVLSDSFCISKHNLVITETSMNTVPLELQHVVLFEPGHARNVSAPFAFSSPPTRFPFPSHNF